MTVLSLCCCTTEYNADGDCPAFAARHNTSVENDGPAGAIRQSLGADSDGPAGAIRQSMGADSDGPAGAIRQSMDADSDGPAVVAKALIAYFVKSAKYIGLNENINCVRTHIMQP